jgi:large subunit ribosomal protein L23
MNDLLNILVKPRISEKAALLAKLNKYVFNVAKSANKISVKRAVEKQYTVKVLQVNMVNTEGKSRNYGRTSGKMSDFKKAIVTIKEGQKIE